MNKSITSITTTTHCLFNWPCFFAAKFSSSNTNNRLIDSRGEKFPEKTAGDFLHLPFIKVKYLMQL